MPKHKRGSRPCPKCGGSMRADLRICGNCERKAIDGAIRYEQPKPKTPIPPELMAGLLIASAAARARK